MFKRFLSLTLLIPLLLVFEGWGQVYLINEGFESAVPPTGWTNNGAIQSSNNPRNGTKTLAFNGVNDAIYTPVLSKPGMLSFWYKRSSNTAAWTLNVQVSTDASDWTSLGTITNASTTYQEFTANLSSYSNIYIRLLDQRGSGTAERYVDDFIVTRREPGTSATSPVFSNVSETGLTLSWTNGDGDGRLVLVKQGSAVDASPVDGTDYTANAAFGSGTEVGTDNYVVFKGSGNSVDITGLTASTTYYISVFEFNGSGTSMNFLTTSPLTGNQTTNSPGLSTPPTLTADATDNTVDYNIEITFTDDATWRGAVTAVKVDGTSLSSPEGYELIEGKLTLKPAGSTSLQTQGSKSVVVEATGYNNALVTQVINAGAPTTNSTATISEALALGTTKTVTATAKDQYSNLVSGYTFKYDLLINNSLPYTNESYTIDGTARTSTVYDVDVVATTNASGVATFTIAVPTVVDQGDGLIVQVQLANGISNVGSEFSIYGPNPTVTFTGVDPSTNSFALNSINNTLYRTQLAVTNNPAELTQVVIAVAGSYIEADIVSFAGFTLWYSTDATFDSGTDELVAMEWPSGDNAQTLTFTLDSPKLLSTSGTHYLFVNVDLDPGATRGSNIGVSPTPTSADFYFTNPVNPAGTFGDGNLHTFLAPAPVLTADNTNNTVDNQIDITFSDENWWGNVTGVNVNGTALADPDWDIASGHLYLNPSNGNALLTSAGDKTVTIDANNHAPATVTQPILAGAPTGSSTAYISAVLALNSTRTVTATAKDQYGNNVSGYTFKFDVTVTNANTTNNESYMIGGSPRTSSETDVSFTTVTDDNGVATLNITIPATVDENDGVSVQVQLQDGITSIGSSFSFTYLPPTVLAAGDIAFLSVQADNPDYISLILLNTVNPSTEVFITDNGWTAVGAFRDNEGILKWTSPTNQLPVGTIINITPATPSVNIGSISVVSGSFAIAQPDQVLIYQGSSTFITAINVTGNWAGDATSSNTSAIPSGLTNGINCLYIASDNGYYSSSLSGSVVSNRLRINNSNNWTTSSTVQTVPYFGNTNSVTISSTSQTSNNLSSNVLANITFAGLSTTGSLVVSQYYTPPTGTDGISETNVGSYRWVIDNSGVVFSGATFRFDIFRLPGNGGIAENASDIKLYKRSTEGSGAWTLVGTLTYNNNSTPGVLSDDYLTISGITSFSEFVMASEGSPLPVELTSFTASANGTSVTLNWETKTEVDNNGFEVERNSTGTWQKIGFVEGHGTANSPKYYSYSDNNPLGNKLQYRLKQIDNDGDFEYSNVVEVELAPVSYTLYQNYPNPFNPSTVIRFAIPVAGNVTVNVFNTLGEKVATLLDGQLESGYHQVTFDAANLPSGLYFYEVQAGEFKSIKKMLLMK